MALLERVSTLVRANLNDLIDRAEHPEKMIKQVILDMQNQLLQVKTQVAIAIADQHLLEKKQKENEDKVAEWMRKAELAVDKKQDDLARAVGKAADAHLTHGNGGHAAAFDRMKRKVAHAEAHSHAKAQIAAEDIEHRLSALEKEDRIEQALVELKTRRGA
ncbi:MAG: phage shock protein A [Acidobacteria bacterium]|nr:MAG: phage shock protein A [Acidobacteriota bacterium]